jgi:hypothetical protein
MNSTLSTAPRVNRPVESTAAKTWIASQYDCSDGCSWVGSV